MLYFKDKNLTINKLLFSNNVNVYNIRWCIKNMQLFWGKIISCARLLKETEKISAKCAKCALHICEIMMY